MNQEVFKMKEILAKIRKENPGKELFQIIIPGQEDELFVARSCNWTEYKNFIGSVKDEASANELLVQKFLVYPQVDYEKFSLEWTPGLIVTLAQQIQKGLGFVGDGASIRNL